MIPLRRWLAFDSIAWAVPLIVALVLAVLMAWISAFNAHPDELHHARAADYYRTHWLPPKFGDPDAVPSYSNYGSSYLHERDIVYLLAGKWSVVVAPLVGDTDLSYRLFNLALFAAIIFAFIRKPEARLLIIPLILSAQIWYVFSYFNGDAFALAVALFTAYQITGRESVFNAALNSNTRLRQLGGVLFLGLGFGLLLLAKRNYYVFLTFLIAYVVLREVGLRASLGVAMGTLIGIGWYFRVPGEVAWWLYAGAAMAVVALIILDVRPRFSNVAFRRQVGMLIAAAAFGMAMFLPRVAFDNLVVQNPANQLSSIEAAQEIFAADGFKPSQMASGGGSLELHIRERGVPYLTMLFGEQLVRSDPFYMQRQWLWRSFQTMTGVYDYVRIASSTRFYVVIGMVYLAFFVSLAYGAWRSRDTNVRHALTIAAVYSGFVVLISSLHSWTSDFQPQGRYLFPAFVMYGVAMKDMRGRLPAAAVLVAALAFVLAAYSFCFAGLSLIPKK